MKIFIFSTLLVLSSTFASTDDSLQKSNTLEKSLENLIEIKLNGHVIENQKFLLERSESRFNFLGELLIVLMAGIGGATWYNKKSLATIEDKFSGEIKEIKKSNKNELDEMRKIHIKLKEDTNFSMSNQYVLLEDTFLKTGRNNFRILERMMLTFSKSNDESLFLDCLTSVGEFLDTVLQKRKLTDREIQKINSFLQYYYKNSRSEKKKINDLMERMENI
jgi:hypothetical protein